MGKIKNLAGKTFGRLYVIKLTDTPIGKRGSYWTCKCICDSITTVHGASLSRGNTKSCGCLRLDELRKTIVTHGLSGTREYLLQASRNSRKRMKENDPDEFYRKSREQARKWKINNPEKVKAHKDNYYSLHRESISVKWKDKAITRREEFAKKSRQYYHAHKDEVAIRAKKYRETHRGVCSVSARTYRNSHRDEIANKKRIYALNNPAIGNAKSGRRRAAKLRATPSWANREAIKAFYVEASRLTRETGISHHVDHVIPLQGKIVSGLHVETNLQVIPAVENLRKGNKVPA